MFHNLKKIALIGFFSLKSKKSILSSKFKNVRLKLENNNSFDLLVKELITEENILYFINTECSFKLFEFFITILMKNATLSLHPNKINTFQLLGFNIHANYKDFTIESTKIDSYIDLNNYDNIVIEVYPNYKIIYQKFEIESCNKLYYRNYILTGNNLNGKNSDLNLNININKLEVDIKKKTGSIHKNYIEYKPLDLIINIDQAIGAHKKITMQKLLVSIKGKKIQIKNGLILNKEILLQDISSVDKSIELYAPNGVVFFDKKQLIVENITVKKNLITLKIKKCIIPLKENAMAELFGIEFFSNNKFIFESQSGVFDFNSNFLSLTSGKVCF